MCSALVVEMLYINVTGRGAGFESIKYFQKNEIENLGRNIYMASVHMVVCSPVFFACFGVFVCVLYVHIYIIH